MIFKNFKPPQPKNKRRTFIFIIIFIIIIKYTTHLRISFSQKTLFRMSNDIPLYWLVQRDPYVYIYKYIYILAYYNAYITGSEFIPYNYIASSLSSPQGLFRHPPNLDRPGTVASAYFPVFANCTAVFLLNNPDSSIEIFGDLGFASLVFGKNVKIHSPKRWVFHGDFHPMGSNPYKKTPPPKKKNTKKREKSKLVGG